MGTGGFCNVVLCTIKERRGWKGSFWGGSAPKMGPGHTPPHHGPSEQGRGVWGKITPKRREGVHNAIFLGAERSRKGKK